LVILSMIIREAVTADIPQIQIVRNLVKENPLPDPSLVTDADCKDYLTNRGKGWVCEIENKIVGFSIISVKDNNVWALFIQPGYERQGIGRLLHDKMMNWYFTQTNEIVWLGTAPGTRAEKFYEAAGWTRTGIRPNGEVRFEMNQSQWKSLRLPA
jgi:ribosomal protein S18 acetylase RimI-like enzyme